jgi:hypothetical protein
MVMKIRDSVRESLVGTIDEERRGYPVTCDEPRLGKVVIKVILFSYID